MKYAFSQTFELFKLFALRDRKIEKKVIHDFIGFLIRKIYLFWNLNKLVNILSANELWNAKKLACFFPSHLFKNIFRVWPLELNTVKILRKAW